MNLNSAVEMTFNFSYKLPFDGADLKSDPVNVCKKVRLVESGLKDFFSLNRSDNYVGSHEGSLSRESAGYHRRTAPTRSKAWNMAK